MAMSDCLNFGSPEDPDVMWQFAEACRGLKDACLEFGVPITGGNVSLYNQTGETAILPTPVVAALGVIEDVTRRTRPASRPRATRVFLLGDTREELSGSEWAHVVHDHLGGLPPPGRPRGRALAGPAAGRRVARFGCHQRPRPVRRRTGPSPGGILLPQRDRGLGVGGRRGGRRRVRGPLRRVRCSSHVTVTTDNADRLVALARPHGVPLPRDRPDRGRPHHRRGRVRDPGRRGDGRLERHPPRRVGVTACRDCR